MSASFRINQGMSTGTYGRARRDITPFSVGGLVTLQNAGGHLTYLWEVLTKPHGAVTVLATPAAVTTTLNTEDAGGYLIRLTVDAGLPTEDVLVLYMGIALAKSSLVLPAANESNQDNSQGPFFDGREGWWEKLEDWLRWADAAVASTTIPGGIYVDSTNGSDITGDGSMGLPYATLAYACSEQAAPDAGNFQVPLIFHLAPGTYLEMGFAPTIPQRQFITIEMNDSLFVGNILWKIDPELWTTFGLDPTTNLPHLSIVAAAPRMEEGGTFSMLGGGRLTVTNDNPSGNLMPRHVLSISGVARAAFEIYNAANGTDVQLDATQTMTLYLRDSYTDDATSVIGGAADYDVALDFVEANEIEIYAERSTLTLVGTCCIKRISDCRYEANAFIDIDGAPYTFGRIQGNPYLSVNVERSYQTKKHGSFFGYNPASARPYTFAHAITFDRSSLIDMAYSTSDMSASFYGFDAVTTTPDTGYGRGWYLDECKDGEASAMIIPQGAAAGSARLLAHAYNYAGNTQPNGSALSKTNRFSLILEAGTYAFMNVMWLWGTDYVDIVGIGSAAVDADRDALSECTILYMDATSTIGCSAQIARFEGFSIMKDTAGVPDLACLTILDTVHHSDYCVFKDLTFIAGPNCAGENPRAVVIGIPAPPP